MSVGFPAVFHLGLFGVGLPFAAWRMARPLNRGPLLPRKSYLASVIVQQLLFGGISLAVARSVGLELFPPFRLTVPLLLAGAAVLVGAVAVQWRAWESNAQRGARRLYLIAPRDSSDRALWLGVAVGAGVFEEVTYRGVLFAILTSQTGSMTIAALVSALAFGLGHLAQGWVGAAITMVFALVFQGLTWWSGSLYLAMAVHAIYDVIAGFRYGWLAKKYGLPDQPPDLVGVASDSLARTPS